jgi:hypothetical protein
VSYIIVYIWKVESHAHLGKFQMLWRTLFNKNVQATSRSHHENEHVHSIGHGEARHRKYKKLKLGSGQAYDRSSE